MPSKVDANATDASMGINNHMTLTQMKYTMINMTLNQHKFIFYLKIRIFTQH